MQEFCIKMSKNDETVAVYFLELCTYVIQNVLNTFSNTEKEILHFVRSPSLKRLKFKVTKTLKTLPPLLTFVPESCQ